MFECIKNIKANKHVKIVAGVILFFVIYFFLYLKVVPFVVSHPKTADIAVKLVKKTTGANLILKNIWVKTSILPNIKFGVGFVKIEKDSEKMLVLANLQTDMSFSEIWKSKLKLHKVGADYVFVDITNISKLFVSEKKSKKKSKNMIKIDWIDSLLYLKNCLFLFEDNGLNVKLEGKGITISDVNNPKPVRFSFDALLSKNGEIISVKLSDNNTVYIKDKKIYVDNGVLGINDSNVFLNAIADEKNGYDVNISSKNFDVKNISSILGSNLIIANGSDIVSLIKDLQGKFDFDFNINNGEINAQIDVYKSKFNLVPLHNIPVVVNKGKIIINPEKILLNDFYGYYGKTPINEIKMSGEIEDYTRSVKTNIVINGLATNEFIEEYLSPVIGYPMQLVKTGSVRLVLNTIYDKVNIILQGKIAKGADILIDGASLSPIDYDRAFGLDMNIENNILDIKSLNYYISSVLDKNTKDIAPILTINGKFNLAQNGSIMNVGFDVPKPLPSEFLNVLIGQKLFKKGTIAGNLQMINTGSYPKLSGYMQADKVIVPSQRLFLRSGRFKADKNVISVNANGRFKRSKYNFDGKINNNLTFPIIVKDTKLSIDNLDVERLMTSLNAQNTNIQNSVAISNEQNIETEEDLNKDDAYVFDTGLLIVEKAVLNIIKGKYKELDFGNLNVNLTLDKKGILNVFSNKFDFARGISTLKVFCDLKNQQYKIRLGVKGVESDLIASSLLSLKKEISGKADGLIDLYSDKSLKLNGEIKFQIRDGVIAKVGLVEYVLKFASLFRNPLAMISPSLIVDLVNIPEGNFDDIYGELFIKDNVIEKMMIKSKASQLSAFIIGRFDLEKRDAALRIYTKFSNSNKGFAGFLRNISLNSLANKVSISGRNDKNYYYSEISQIPQIDAPEKDCQIFLTKVDGDVERNNFISSLKKIK